MNFYQLIIIVIYVFIANQNSIHVHYIDHLHPNTTSVQATNMNLDTVLFVCNYLRQVYDTSMQFQMMSVYERKWFIP